MPQFVNSPTRFPYTCRSCGGGVESPGRSAWVDFGEDDNPPGDGPASATVYLCDLCIMSTAEQLGGSTPQNAADSAARIESLEAELFAAKVKADGLEQGLSGLLRARFLDVADAPELVHLLDDPESADEGPGASGEHLDPGAGASAEQVDVEGVDDVRTDDGGDASFLNFA